MSDLFETINAAAEEIRCLDSSVLRQKLNQLTAPHSLEDDKHLVGDLAVWVAHHRQFNGDFETYWRRQRAVRLKLAKKTIPLCKRLQHHLKEALKEKSAPGDITLTGLHIDAQGMLDQVQRWIFDLQDLETSVRRQASKRGVPGYRHHRQFVLLIAFVWHDVKGKAPSLSRDGPFIRYVEHVRQMVPKDCRPPHLSAESIRSWLKRDLPMVQKGRIGF
jgi:hypothetical protein